jgi:hypothetical protein
MSNLNLMSCLFSIQRPHSTRSYRSLSFAQDGNANTPCSRISTSSNQDSRLKRAAAQERRQATRKFDI